MSRAMTLAFVTCLLRVFTLRACRHVWPHPLWPRKNVPHSPERPLGVETEEISGSDGTVLCPMIGCDATVPSPQQCWTMSFRACPASSQRRCPRRACQSLRQVIKSLKGNAEVQYGCSYCRPGFANEMACGVSGSVDANASL